jgi:DUF438 domain-containing protein
LYENNTLKFKQQNAYFFDDVEPAKWKSKLENVSKNKVLSKAKTKQPESKLKVKAKDSKLVSSYGIFAYANSCAMHLVNYKNYSRVQSGQRRGFLHFIAPTNLLLI